MLCPECGAEVVHNAVYCHKCGERMELADPQFPHEPEESEPHAEDPSVRGETGRPDATAQRGPRERFQEAATDRQAITDEPERELWRGHYCGKAMIGAWLLSGLITLAALILAIVIGEGWFWWAAAIGLIVLWIYQLLRYAYRRLNVSYQFTTQRLIHHTGILRRVTDRIEVIDMDDIRFEQTILERLVGAGTIRITSSDRSHPELLLRGIDNVKEVAEIVGRNKVAEIRAAAAQLGKSVQTPCGETNVCPATEVPAACVGW